MAETTLPKEYNRFLAVLIGLNCLAVLGAIIAGLHKEPVSFYFREREIITFLSALQMGMASLVSFLIFNLHYRRGNDNSKWFWLLCSFGFLWLMADEWFMIHEGIDDGLLAAFGLHPTGKHFLWDWLVIAAYGVGALYLCLRFHHEIRRTSRRFALICSAAVFYLATTFIDALGGGAVHMIIEESLKLISVNLFFLFFLTAFYESLRELIVPAPALPADRTQSTFGH